APRLLSFQYIARSAATGRSATTVVATPRSGTTSLTLIANLVDAGMAYWRVSGGTSGGTNVTPGLVGCALGLSTRIDIWNGAWVVPSAKYQRRESVTTPWEVWTPPSVNVLSWPKIIVRSVTIGWVAITRAPKSALGSASPTVTT